jgi:hypothetical protein
VNDAAGERRCEHGEHECVLHAIRLGAVRQFVQVKNC